MNEVTPPTKKQSEYIRRNIDRMPFHAMRNSLKVQTHTMYQWIKMIYQPEKYVIVDDGPQVHSHYLVTLNGFNYIVSFNVGVDYESIQYCGHRIGFDYEVSKLGFWEYNHLKNNIPTIALKTDANYVSNFWATTKLWSE